MNSLKILVSSWDSLYPPTATDETEKQPLLDKEDLELSPQDLDDLDKQIRASVDQDIDSTIDNGADTATLPGPGTASKDNTDTDNTEDTNEGVLDPGLVMSLLYYILFVPNYVVVKPVTFLWFLVTFPFTYFFEGEPKDGFDFGAAAAAAGESGPQNRSRPNMDADTADADGDGDADADVLMELLKHENLISNTIKSPSLSSKYLIPPPVRLFPLSRNPMKPRKRKTLILDLDETLIHSVSRGSRSFNGGSHSGSSMIEIRLNHISSLYYVYKRPHCDYFLREAAKWFELQVFTASVKEYADPIINWLETEIAPYVHQDHMKRQRAEGVPVTPAHSNQPIFTKRYYRTDCTYRPGVGYIKDLSKFFPREEELKNVIILDNSPVSYALHEDNAVMIEGWINDQSDKDLVNLLPMLHSLSLCIDVRYILGLRGGEKVFEN